MNKILEAAKELLKNMETSPDLAQKLSKAYEVVKCDMAKDQKAADKAVEGAKQPDHPAVPPGPKKTVADLVKEKESSKIKKEELDKSNEPHSHNSPEDKVHDVVEEHEKLKHAMMNLSPEGKSQMLAHLRTLISEEQLRSKANQEVGKAEIKEEELDGKQQEEKKTDPEKSEAYTREKAKLAADKAMNRFEPKTDAGRRVMEKIAKGWGKEEVKKEETGVHSKEKHHFFGKDKEGRVDLGVSIAGAKTRSARNNYETERAKAIHADKLAELKAMPKPNLPKAELDKEEKLMKPYSSEAQRRWAHTEKGKKALGGEAKVKEWDKESKGKDLPEKVEKAGEHQPHPGPSKSGHQKAYDAKKQAESEAKMKTPAGEKERMEGNMARMKKAKIDEGMAPKAKAMARFARNKHLEAGSPNMKNIKGVHKPMVGDKSGTSNMGGHTNPATMKQHVKRVTAESKAMPKPNLPKSEKK